MQAVVVPRVCLRESSVKRIAQVVPNDGKGEREELARKTTARHVQREVVEAIENKQPHTREVPLERATKPTA